MLLDEPGRPLRARRGARAGGGARAAASCASRRAGSAAPTCTCATASSSRGTCRSCSGTRSSASPRTAGGSGCRGWAGPAASARIAAPGARTCACAPASPAATSTAATRSGPWRTSASASRCPADGDPLQLAPLLCGGLIGHRALRLAGDGERLGLYGFGAAAHIICQVAVARGPARVRVHPRRGRAAQALARSLGAEWAGDATAPGPEPLDAALIFAPVGRARARRAARRRARRHGRVRRDPHVRHPLLPLRATCGRSACCAPSPT